MNRERVQELRDYMAALPADRIIMQDWWRSSECGTVGCIAGYAAFLIPDSEIVDLGEEGSQVFLKDGSSEEIETAAINHLEITAGVANSLFYRDSWPYRLRVQYNSARTALERKRQFWLDWTTCFRQENKMLKPDNLEVVAILLSLSFAKNNLLEAVEGSKAVLEASKVLSVRSSEHLKVAITDMESAILELSLLGRTLYEEVHGKEFPES